jgi:hypothetical protein
MRILFLCFVLFAGQMNSLQDKPVVHLKPHSTHIEIGFGGSLLELANASPIIDLPSRPPKTDMKNRPWSVDIKNFGPGVVTVNGPGQFSVAIEVGQTVHISSNGSIYSKR